ncbi:DUF5801 domain-containing protein [Devosia sp. LjRoot16]|uniref:DUF5801 repeats-in-toxin domain-containing protein n=1 Tax=Devosia sp. LjRoot16 TaxID=3342271 RepID=UPI003ECEE1E6
MAIVLTGDEFVVLDESQGLQNTGVSSTNEDNDDNDIVYTDLPAAFATRLFDAGQLNLSSAFAQANGAAQNDFISLTDGSTLTGFVKSDGSALLAYDAGTTVPTTGVLAGFTTVDGEAIYLFADEATGLGSSMFLGVDVNGDIVLAGYLEADGTISTVQFEAITNPDSGNHDDPVDLSGLLDVGASGTIDFDFDDLPSSNNLFATLGASPDGPAIVIFGADIHLQADGTPTNTSDMMFMSQAGPNATIGMNNQMFNPGDAAFFAYVNDVNADFLSGWEPNGLTGTEADDADNALYTGGTLDVTAAQFTIAQIQGNGTGSMKLTTYLGAADTARDLLTGPTDGATSPNIIAVNVTIGGVTTTFDNDADPAVSGFDVSGLGTTTVTLTGVDDGYLIEFVTDSEHNRVKIEGTAGKFDIGGFTITEGTFVHEPVGDRIVFEDDGPSVGDGEGTPALTVDDSDFTTNDSASYANLFDVDFGTDGGKDSDNDGTVDVDAVTYSLSIGVGASGLTDTLTGDAVVLSMDGAAVVGKAGAAGPEVFRITVDVNTGEVTLDQSRAVVHDDPDDDEESGSPAQLASADLIALTATATDDDGDTDDHTVGIGDTFNFEDDGPSIDRNLVEVPALTVDDSDFATNDSADFSVLFTTAFGNDGPKDTDDNDIADADAITYELGINAGASGLTDTLTGDAVVLSMDGAVVVGMVGTEEVFRITVDADTGEVTLDQSRAVVHDDPDDDEESGSPAQLAAANLVTLTATAYDGDGDHDDAIADIGLAFNFEDDGPSIDRNQVEVPALTVDDSDFATNDSADFSVVFTTAFGNDGPLDADDDDVADADAITYELGINAGASGLTDTLTGDAVVLSMDGAAVVGMVGAEEVFRITVDADTGEVTLDQSRAVVHDDPDDDEESSSPAQLAAANLVTLTAVAVDGDGDHDDAVADIGLAFNFEDDGPSIDRNQVEVPALTVDDSDFTTNDSADFSVVFTTAFGNDGPLDADDDDVADADAITYELGINAGASGLTDTLTGDPVVLSMDGAAVVGMVGTEEVFRITVDADTGEVTLDQSRAVVHDDPDDDEESGSPAQLAAANLVTLTAVAVDGDGDHDDAVADIGLAFNFEDDGPSIDRNLVEVPALTVDDSDFATNDSADFSGLFTTAFGNDGPKDTDDNDIADEDAITYELGINAGASGLTDTLTGDAVVLSMDGAAVVGMVGAEEVFRITVDANSGEVTLDQSRAVVHDDPDDDEESGSPAQLAAANLVTLTATAYDGDGDHDDAIADIGLAFNFEDDGPSIDRNQVEVPALTVDDSDFTTNDSADFSVVFTTALGNDGPLDADDDDVADADAITYELGINAGASGLTDTLTGDPVVLSMDGAAVVGMVGTEEVFRITVDADTGEVTLDQSRAVVHDDPDDDEESSSPAQLAAANLVTLTAVAVDGDLDHDDAVADIGLAFNFEDDGPSIDRNLVEVPDLVVDESAFGSVFADFSSLFDTVFGNDGPKDTDDNDTPDDDAITYAVTISNAGDDTGLIDSLTGEAVVLDVEGLDVIGVTEIGGLEVFRVSADGETGVVTLTQSRAVKHDDPDDPDESSSPATFTSANLVSLVATAYDGDGDHDSATLDISATFKFEDDGPAIGPIAGGMVDFANGDTVSNLLGALPGADGADAKITDFTESFDFGFATVVGVQEGDQTVTYYEDENGNGSIDPGEDTAFFRLSLDTTGDDPAAWSYLFETLKDPEPASIEFNFDELPSGANLFGVVGESSSDPAILVFGKKAIVNAAGNYTNKSDVIHTSQGGTGATIGVNNQMFDPGEGAYFVYIDDPVANFLSGVPGGLSPTEADDADNVQYTGGTVDVTTASITISQMQGNKGASMKLTTFLGTAEQGRDMVLTPNGTSPNIIEVRVIKPDGTIYEFDSDSDPAIGFIDVTGLGGTSVVVTGLDKGYTVEWDTDTLHNRVLVEGVAGKFDVGKFSIGETGTTPDGQLDFEVTIEDFDTAGDTAVADFTIGIDGDLDGVITI